MRSENSSLSNTVRSLRRELEELRTASKLAMSNATDESKVNELKVDLIQTRQELGRARDALAGGCMGNGSELLICVHSALPLRIDNRDKARFAHRNC